MENTSMTDLKPSDKEMNTIYTKTGIVIKVLPKEPNREAVNQIMKILKEEDVI
jgi:hypothetical protein